MSDFRMQERRGTRGVMVLELSGRLDGAGAGELDARLAELDRRAEVRLVVSCEELDELSSEAAGVFLSHLVRFKNAGGDILLCDVSETTRATLSLMGLAKLLVVYDSEDEACGRYGGGEAPSSEDASEPLEIRSEDVGAGCAIVRPRGAIDRRDLERLDAELARLDAAGKAWLLVDGGRLSYLSSTGMGVFIAVQPRFAARGGGIAFFDLDDLVKTVITTLGLHRIFPLYGSEAEALAALPEAHRGEDAR